MPRPCTWPAGRLALSHDATPSDRQCAGAWQQNLHRQRTPASWRETVRGATLPPLLAQGAPLSRCLRAAARCCRWSRSVTPTAAAASRCRMGCVGAGVGGGAGLRKQAAARPTRTGGGRATLPHARGNAWLRGGCPLNQGDANARGAALGGSELKSPSRHPTPAHPRPASKTLWAATGCPTLSRSAAALPGVGLRRLGERGGSGALTPVSLGADHLCIPGCAAPAGRHDVSKRAPHALEQTGAVRTAHCFAG